MAREFVIFVTGQHDGCRGRDYASGTTIQQAPGRILSFVLHILRYCGFVLW